MKNSTRASGILLPIFSLPSNYGIGTFGKEAFAFVDMLKQAKQKYWQILPLGPISFGDSPYQSFSTFAGNPYFIDLELLIEEGLLTKQQCDAVHFGDSEGCIDYKKIYDSRFQLIRSAYEKSAHRLTKDFSVYREQNQGWLPDYCLYMALKQHFDNAMWIDWDEDIKLRKTEAMQRYRTELADEIEFQCFMQYTFSRQWCALKDYANKNGVKIIGDLPIYVAMDSADTWAHPEMFQFDEKLNPLFVAGVPADDFSEDGQLWGNPLYQWEAHRKDRFHWWIERIAFAAKLYDMLRIDHFRGFEAYWSIPYGAETAVCGDWRKGPGLDLLTEIENQLGDVNIIAEDLGVQSDSLRMLLNQSGYPGMKVLQFGFSDRQDSEHLPHNYKRSSVVYTGTHDNTSTLGWYDRLKPEDRAFVNEYCRVTSEKPIMDIIAVMFQSVADLVIIPLQDYLGLGDESRINTPSTLGGNWMWRMQKGQFTESIQAEIAQMTATYFRD